VLQQVSAKAEFRQAEDVLQSVWNELSQESINKAVLSFIKRLWAWV